MSFHKTPDNTAQAPDISGSEGFHIRDARAADAMKIAQLHSESWQSAYRGLARDSYLDGPLVAEHREHWLGLLTENPGNPAAKAQRPEGFIRLAERDGSLVGFITLWVDYKAGYDAYVDNLHVRPGQRGGGIGKGLLRDAAASAAAQGCKNLSLEVLDGNSGAIRFYERLGGVYALTAQDDLGGTLLDYRLMVWDDIAKLATPGT